MEFRWNRSLVAIVLVAMAGCNSSSSTTSDSSSAKPTDLAALTAHEFLEAVVKGDTARANQLLTPLAVERIAASGKPFQLPGLANYTFRVGQVRQPAEDRAFVQCMGTDRAADGKAVEEEFCWILSRIDGQWRVAGISYAAGPQQTLMIYSFENPERGAVPAQQLVARRGQSAAVAGPPSTPHSMPTNTPPSHPQTAQQPASSTYR